MLNYKTVYSILEPVDSIESNELNKLPLLLCFTSSAATKYLI